ncbi:MAG: pyruvate/2-oxoglutarate/acetoin dehydrogenase E1 component [Flavobacterium sp.]|jgi:pyruvate/2-oxoglutarate/acetoin dehydrogenase E1 component
MSEMRKLPYVAAITEGVREVLLEQENAFVAGEDVGQAGSVFGYYAGLFDEFGGERMVDTPISEKGIIGLGVGASACGCRPIVDLMFMDFIGECMDEIANQMAKMRFMFGGGVTLPVTVITMAGAGMNLAAQHSQSLEAWLAHLPGVKVVMPSNAYDAKGMIIAAARDDNPVFVVLNKASLALQSEVPEGAYEVEIGKAKVVREGSNFTIIAISRMVHEATKAAKQLAELGVDVEVIDVRSIQPFDTETVIQSIKKTHRAIVVHEAVEFGGFGGEIVAQIQELAFDYLDAPIGRVGAPFCPVPFSPALEKIYVPNAERIVSKVKQILDL